MEATIIVLFARAWEMTDESTGEKRSGVSIQYVMSDTLEPKTSEDDMGYQVIKESVTVECAKGLVDAPGIYKAGLELKASGGKNVLHVSSLDFIKPLISAE